MVRTPRRSQESEEPAEGHLAQPLSELRCGLRRHRRSRVPGGFAPGGGGSTAGTGSGRPRRGARRAGRAVGGRGQRRSRGARRGGGAGAALPRLRPRSSAPLPPAPLRPPLGCPPPPATPRAGSQARRSAARGQGEPGGRSTPRTHSPPCPGTPATPLRHQLPWSPRRRASGCAAERSGHWLRGAVSHRARPAGVAVGFPDRERGETIPSSKELQLPACSASAALTAAVGSGLAWDAGTRSSSVYPEPPRRGAVGSGRSASPLRAEWRQCASACCRRPFEWGWGGVRSGRNRDEGRD
ncbi:uncharacterized protein C10orf95-like [Pezoporus occidentalis]|uniref:uncharacterized protein C10orf95-like n=1 Tax=Pezoporus occidentalis TaxID=407982 RepID=UPI002F9134A6